MIGFETVIAVVLSHEGGYVNDPRDPGGETKFGISKRQYPTVDIAALTYDDAVKIYRADYWDKYKVAQLPPHLRLTFFDCAVNQGGPRAVKFLQAALGVPVDGLIGPKTIAAATLMPKSRLLREFTKRRLEAYSANPNYETYGKGWTRRLMEVSLNDATLLHVNT
jgi:lysozyme family protein